MSIAVEELRYTYAPGLPGETTALDGLSFALERGTSAAIIGPTGSGKSTLLLHLGALLQPEAGRVLVEGHCISDGSRQRAEISRAVGLVFQYPEYQLFEETVWRDVCYGPRNLGFTEEEIARAADEALSLVGLDREEVAARSPFELSGGEKRRVALAGVLAMRPRVLLLDEPTAGLDPVGRREMLALMQRLRKDPERTLVFVSHSMADVAALADQVIVLRAGRVQMQGTPTEVFAREEELCALGLGVPPITGMISAVARRTGRSLGVVFDADTAADRLMAGREGA